MSVRAENDLKRLQGNVLILLERLERQQDTIKRLEQELSETKTELTQVSQQYRDALEESKRKTLALGLVGNDLPEKTEAQERLDKIIDQVTYCIQQLEAEEVETRDGTD